MMVFESPTAFCLRMSTPVIENSNYESRPSLYSKRSTFSVFNIDRRDNATVFQTLYVGVKKAVREIRTG